MRIDWYQRACERIEDEAESNPETLDAYVENDMADLARCALVMVSEWRESDKYQWAHSQVVAIQRRAIKARIAEEADALADELGAEYRDELRDAETDARVDRMLQEQVEAV